MEKLMKEDFEKLNKDYIYVAKRKFNVDLTNDVTSVYISDVLISLYFEGKRNDSRIAISLVGSFVGQTVISEWGGDWFPENFSIKYVGKNKITVNPFSISHQRLTKGVNKTLFRQLEMVSHKANNEELYDRLDEDRISFVFNRLYNDGWWPISMIYKKNLPNYVKYEIAYILGLMAKYLKDKENIKQKFRELLENKETTYYACVVFQNCLFSEFIDKILEIISSKDYSNNVKAQAISALIGREVKNDEKIMDYAHKLLFKLDNPILKFYVGNLLGTFDNPKNIQWINNNLLNNNVDEFSKLALLVAVQLLRKKEFVNTMLSIFLNGNAPESIKDEIIKTLHLLPVSEEIYHLRKKYDNFDMKNKIGFINIVLFSDFNKKKQVLLDILSSENDSFVKSYILSALDNLSEE
ncbi:MAG: hypothetical protein RMJ51_02690 [Candidatus Calescibacterium sp.]|nr:hypothetical protein [Candidatus Calescibacterium sp.]MCX7972264.1 hypothetical protein [bacterium]MDW8195134.1 hypothetical protein [Candidatus Calescibacterium sp.]